MRTSLLLVASLLAAAFLVPSASAECVALVCTYTSQQGSCEEGYVQNQAYLSMYDPTGAPVVVQVDTFCAASPGWTHQTVNAYAARSNSDGTSDYVGVRWQGDSDAAGERCSTEAVVDVVGVSSTTHELGCPAGPPPAVGPLL